MALGLVVSLGFALIQAVSTTKPGFVKGALGYRGNLMLFQANGSSSQTNDCDQAFRSVAANGDSLLGSIQWPCDEGADLVIGTYFGKGVYTSATYYASIFPVLLWVPLTDSMNPVTFNLKVPATLHLYLSRFSKVAWDQPFGLQLNEEPYQTFDRPGHYTFDLSPGQSHTFSIDAFPGLDFAASGIYVTENENPTVFV